MVGMEVPREARLGSMEGGMVGVRGWGRCLILRCAEAERGAGLWR